MTALSPSAFKLQAPYAPAGDQPEAIQAIRRGFEDNIRFQTLLGVTGSGKTFTVANIIQEFNLPTLVITHNKTLVAQLYQEFKSYFPRNAVEYFVSYYDYYQPEAYLPVTDTYIEKDSSVNSEIEKLRLRTTASLMSRKDVIVVASVSCIFGLGSPREYQAMMVEISTGMERERDRILRDLVDIHYTRNDYDFRRGTFRVRGDVIEIHPAYDDFAVRIELFGDTVERLSRIDLLKGEPEAVLDKVLVYPARHFVTQEADMERVIAEIKRELEQQKKVFHDHGKLLEAQRIESRTNYDLEMLAETGFCSGIENYSRVIDNRPAGTPPNVLLDFFSGEFLVIIDESHVTIPQIAGMYAGDRSRKKTLVEFGFRLPCALDNRPLNFREFEERLPRTLFVSATPADYELKKTSGVVVEQVVRPTGLVDPVVEVRPVKGQIDDLLKEVHERIDRDEKTLVVTLTKKSAEDLTDFMKTAGLKTLYMHSETKTLKRIEIIKMLREGAIDVLVGINLLREGLDLPEVSLIIILDADKEGFLRNKRTLIQVIGRAARNVNGKVIMYADNTTGSMEQAIGETRRRRKVQEKFNLEHGIKPRTIIKEIRESIRLVPEADARVEDELTPGGREADGLTDDLDSLEQQMLEAADNLDFERAAELRDRIKSLKGAI
ncbi:excinuclease ABC subunit UvrB [Fibrobacterota bacterium]